MKFKLLPKVGNHAETGKDGKVTIYKSEDGRIIETAHDLVKMFPGKFERVEVPLGKADEEVPEPSEPPVEEEKAEEKPKPKSKAKKSKSTSKSKKSTPKSKLGKDVTKRFPKAKEEDFQVFSNGKSFSVVEADDPGKPLNDKPLKRKEVDPFIEKFLQG